MKGFVIVRSPEDGLAALPFDNNDMRQVQQVEQIWRMRRENDLGRARGDGGANLLDHQVQRARIEAILDFFDDEERRST